jgi:hypothetical protein
VPVVGGDLFPHEKHDREPLVTRASDKLPGNIDAVVLRENSHLQIARPERSVHRHWRLGADPIAAWVNVEIGVTDEWRSVHQGRPSQVRASAR